MSSSTLTLKCGASAIRVDSTILKWAEGRVNAKKFECAQSSNFSVRHVPRAAEDAHKIEAVLEGLAFVRHEANDLEVTCSENMYAAESVLRYAYSVGVERQKGVLLHSSSVSFGEYGVLAFGESGAGKTTFAQLCCDFGGATLLSDEMNAVFSEGHVGGTPFRSSELRPGSPGPCQLKAIFSLVKGSKELIEKRRAIEVLPELVRQTYTAPWSVNHKASLEVLSTILSRIPTYALTFRKHEEVGRFLRTWVCG